MRLSLLAPLFLVIPFFVWAVIGFIALLVSFQRPSDAVECVTPFCDGRSHTSWGRIAAIGMVTSFLVMWFVAGLYVA